MLYLLEHAKHEAEQTARKATLSLGGVALMLVGVGFLTTAGWIVLAEMRDAVFASLVCGGAFIGAGLLLLGVAKVGTEKAKSSTAQAYQAQASQLGPTWAPLVAAFMEGVAMGRQGRIR